jgi:hypothetical protein
VRLLLLGAPDYGRDCWHDDLVTEAAALGWRVDFQPVKSAPVDDLVRAAKGADLLIWARTHRHDPDGDAAAMLRRVEDAGTATVGLHLDLYWGVPGREHRIGKDPWWSCQRVFTADGGPRPWHTRGVTHGWCPPATAAARLGRVKPAGTARYVFAGRTMAVHGPHRAHMVAWARYRWGERFAAYGEPPETAVYGAELAGMVSYAWCVLGDSAPASHYWSDRVVRTLARGGVLAHPKTAGMAEQGFDDTTMVRFDRTLFGPLGDRLDAMTKRERDGLRQAGMAVVRDRHLWRHRLEQIAREVL